MMSETGPILLDPQLLVAARRGDSERLKDLLQERRRLAFSVEGELEQIAGAPAVGVDDMVTLVEGDNLLHVVASCGDDDGFLHCATMIVAEMRHLLEARNREGDTPLHCAAAAGNAKMISYLVDLQLGNNDADEVAVKAFLRMQNKSGETALHQAVRAARNKVACIDQLMSVDPELACIPHENGVSPLYLAISLGELRIARQLLDKTQGRLSYSGPYGRNVLHASVSRGQALAMVVGWLERADVDLLPRLTIQKDTTDGSTPLHLLAASLGGWPWAAQFISRWLPQACVPSGSDTMRIRLLLHANKSTAYEVDETGLYPIHLAAWAGSLGGVKALLGDCPDCATLRDCRGRTFLHVAVEESRYGVVEYVCRQSQSRRQESRYSAVKYVSSILNAQDVAGNTPLHLAVHVGNLAVLNCLVGNRLVRLDVPNKEGMTPADLALTMIPSEYYILSNQRGYIWVTLLYMGAPSGENRADRLFLRADLSMEIERKETLSRELSGALQVMGIVSVLIATVTFASAFTLPGGYRSPDADGPATPVLAGTYAFDAFVLSDALAFICSFLATFSLFYAGSPSVDLSIRLWYINTAALLLLNSGRSLVVAFALAFYMVLAPVARTVAITVCVIVLPSLLHGNWEAWQILSTAKKARARFGRCRMAQAVPVVLVFALLLEHFWSYVIIFGLPAIRMWAATT